MLFYGVPSRQPKRGLCALCRFTNDGFDFIACRIVYFMAVNLMRPYISQPRPCAHSWKNAVSITLCFHFTHRLAWVRAKIGNPIVFHLFIYVNAQRYQHVFHIRLIVRESFENVPDIKKRYYQSILHSPIPMFSFSIFRF